MTPDQDLPVWTIRPNWSDPVIEALEWLTDILVSESGAEQRRAVRVSPRRSLEAKFTPTDGERSFLSLALQRLGKQEWMVPLWHDRAVLGAAVASASSSLPLQTDYREFVAGGMALLVGPDAFSCEAVRIASVTPTALTLVAPTISPWEAGTVVHPLRRARIDANNFGTLSSRVGSGQIRFEISRENDFDEGVNAFPVYEGAPILVTRPNWSRPINTSLAYAAFETEAVSGRKFVVDPAGRAFASQQHSWLLAGRQEQYEFRQLLYRLRGRAKGLWLPTFLDDMVLAHGAVMGDQILDIGQIGLGYVGGPAPGREHILLGMSEGAKIDALGAAAAGEERLVLAAPITQALDTGSRIHFLDMVRLDQDRIEITHHADSDGAAEIAAAFTAFNAARDGSAPGYLPIPAAVMTAGACGAVDECACPPGWVEELYFVLPTPLPALPNDFDPEEVGSSWLAGENLRAQILLNLPHGSGRADFQFQFAMATIANANATDGYGAGLDCWFVRKLSHPSSAAFVAEFDQVDPNAPLYAYRYTTADNRLTVRTWYPFARDDGVSGTETVNLFIYGLRADTGPYGIEVWQSDETGANHQQLSFDFGTGPDYYFIDSAETIEIVENYYEYVLRGDLP